MGERVVLQYGALRLELEGFGGGCSGFAQAVVGEFVERTEFRKAGGLRVVEGGGAFVRPGEAGEGPLRFLAGRDAGGVGDGAELAGDGRAGGRIGVLDAGCGGGDAGGGGDVRRVVDGVSGASSGSASSSLFSSSSFSPGSVLSPCLSGGVVSERTLANRRKRELKKLRKQRKRASSVVRPELVGPVCGGGAVPEWRREAGPVVGRGFFSGASAEVRGELVRTRAERLAAENALATYKAERQLRLEKAKDEGQMLKRQETQLLRDVELNRVRIEKAHSTLLATGNVAGERGGGFAQTVVSSSSSSGGSGGVGRSSVGCSISPSSSVTDREVRAVMQECESLRLEVAELKKSGGVVREKTASVKTGYTADSRGRLAEHHMNAWGPESYHMGKDGRFHDGDGGTSVFYDFDSY